MVRASCIIWLTKEPLNDCKGRGGCFSLVVVVDWIFMMPLFKDWCLLEDRDSCVCFDARIRFGGSL